jgi:hypothetical protein
MFAKTVFVFELHKVEWQPENLSGIPLGEILMN